MKTNRIFLLLVVLAVSILSVACTDYLDIQGLPPSCKDQNGADTSVRMEMRISQAGEPKAAATVIVSKTGEADFKIGASTQQQSQLRSGHRPEKQPDLNAIYTADPVSIELKFKDPCKLGTKTLTVVPDDLPQEKIAGGRVRYTVKFDQFKP
jgi:hypothetical protein